MTELRLLLCLVIAATAGVLVPPASGAGARAGEGGAGFLSELSDVPLMPGLVEIEGVGMTFDDPAGRIVESYAAGAVERAAVVRFYHATLPQLGWLGEGESGTFRREGEVLRLEFIEGGDELMVRFFLSPG